MNKRLSLLAACLTITALGVSACGGSGDGRASASAAPSATTSAANAPAGRPSSSPAQGHELTKVQEAFFLRTIRDYVPELAGIEPDALVKHANALCTARGQALKEQLQKTREELKLDKNQMTKLTAQALIRCRPELAR